MGANVFHDHGSKGFHADISEYSGLYTLIATLSLICFAQLMWAATRHGLRTALSCYSVHGFVVAAVRMAALVAGATWNDRVALWVAISTMGAVSYCLWPIDQENVVPLLTRVRGWVLVFLSF